jgi:hypothetical protein
VALQTEDQSARHRSLLLVRYADSVGATFTDCIAYHTWQEKSSEK